MDTKAHWCWDIMAAISQTTVLNAFVFNENICICIRIRSDNGLADITDEYIRHSAPISIN